MGDYFQQIGEVMGPKCFKCWKLCDLTDNVHLDDVISNKYLVIVFESKGFGFYGI